MTEDVNGCVSCKILVVVPEVVDNGAIRFNFDLAGALRRLGVDVRVFALRPGEASVLVHFVSVAPISTGFPHGWRRRYGAPVMAVRLLREARKADVVVSGWEVGDGLVAAFVAGKAMKKPVVALVQGHPIASLDSHVPGWTNQATRWAYPRLDAVVCASPGLLAAVTAMGTPSDRAQVIRSGIDVTRVRRLAVASEPGWLPKGPFVLGLGRLAREKGFDLLIEAHARVRGARYSHQLVILGEGPERAALAQLAARLGVSDTVLLPGFVRNPYPVLARASLFCLPSRVEGWGLALAEAIALGVPVIAADCPTGPADVLGGGAYGELVEANSATALATSIAQHFDTPEVLVARACAGRDHAQSFSVESRAEDYVAFFTQVLEQQSPREDTATATRRE
jgi:glycosyltransferase involved in cell wall biosynthesis